MKDEKLMLIEEKNEKTKIGQLYKKEILEKKVFSKKCKHIQKDASRCYLILGVFSSKMSILKRSKIKDT